MKNLLVTLFLILLSYISSAQSGWGYVNYTSYKTHNGNGSQNQYGAFANTAADFDAMFNTANSNTTISHTGETAIVNLYNGSSAVPKWNSDYFGYKFEFFFVPQQTGTYYFGINSDDASDLSMDGTIIVSYYGGHGASSWQTVPKNLVAGQRYRMVYRGQEFGGGEAFYFMWYRPVGGWGYWNNEVTNVGLVPNKQAKMNFDFGVTLDKTKFSVSSLTIPSTGLVDITNALDSNKVETGNKATIDVSNWESVIINPYESNIGGHRLMLDERMFNSSSPKFNSIKSIKLLDIYDGPVSVYDTTGWWKTYLIPTNVANKITTSAYQSSLRLQDGWYAVQAGNNISYTPTTAYKEQSVTITTTNNLATLYNSIITVSDVWLAFKEVANVGIFGNQSGNEFTYGIQYKNADVNGDGQFNEPDAFALLQHLTGKKNIVDIFNLKNTLKIIPTTAYNNIGKSNWNTSPSYLSDTILFDINTGKAIDTFNYAGTWKGDVNLSHSATPASNGITTMAVRTMSLAVSNQINTNFISEIIGDKIIITLSVDPLQQELVGTQFQLNYDNTLLKFEKIDFVTKGNSTNFGTDMGSYVKIGSLITDGSTLDKTTEYKITFTPKTNIESILGLTSIKGIDAVNKNGTQLKINVN